VISERAPKHKILVVDDSPVMLKALDRVLRGYPAARLEPHLARDGAEAFARLDEHPDVALVMLDLDVPALRGLDVLRKLREQEATRDIPVVLQSTEDQMAEVHLGLSAGARAYITKPFRIIRLYRLLDALLAKAGPDD